MTYVFTSIYPAWNTESFSPPKVESVEDLVGCFQSRLEEARRNGIYFTDDASEVDSVREMIGLTDSIVASRQHPMVYVLRNGKPRHFEILVAAGFPIDTVDESSGDALVHIAFKRGLTTYNSAALRILQVRGANFEARDRAGKTVRDYVREEEEAEARSVTPADIVIGLMRAVATHVNQS